MRYSYQNEKEKSAQYSQMTIIWWFEVAMFMVKRLVFSFRLMHVFFFNFPWTQKTHSHLVVAGDFFNHSKYWPKTEKKYLSSKCIGQTRMTSAFCLHNLKESSTDCVHSVVHFLGTISGFPSDVKRHRPTKLFWNFGRFKLDFPLPPSRIRTCRPPENVTQCDPGKKEAHLGVYTRERVEMGRTKKGARGTFRLKILSRTKNVWSISSKSRRQLLA